MVITLSGVTVDGQSGTFGCRAAYSGGIGTATSSTRTLHVLGLYFIIDYTIGVRPFLDSGLMLMSSAKL